MYVYNTTKKFKDLLKSDIKMDNKGLMEIKRYLYLFIKDIQTMCIIFLFQFYIFIINKLGKHVPIIIYNQIIFKLQNDLNLTILMMILNQFFIKKS